MGRNGRSIWRSRALAMVLVFAHGCGSLRLPAIDPSGRNILLPSPSYTTLAGHQVDPVTGQKSRPLLDHFRNKREPAFTSPPAVPDCAVPAILPNQQSAVAPDPPTNQVAPRVLVPGPCEDPLLAAQNANTGCLGHARTPSNPQAVVTLSPQRQIAAVGTEVVLLGGVCDGDGFYRMREPLEWALAEGSVGHFVEPGQAFVGRLGIRGCFSGMFAEPLPQLVSNNYAVACTSKKVQVLTRGSVETNDDVIVEKGQAWVGVTSPLEGDTYVTLMAPDLDGWGQRKQTAVIHWVDGRWTLPPATVIQGLQPHTLTTRVVRSLSANPIAGWVVRYRILDATANFPDGEMERDVPTDANGEASIQIVPALPAGGMARVQVQVIRPPRGTAEQLLVGDGTTSITWNTSQLALKLRGPETVDLNQEVTYQVELSNPGSLAVPNVTIQSLVPAGFTLLGTSPQGQLFGSRLEWIVDQIGPGERRAFDMTFKASQSGTVRHCANARTATGTAIEDCMTTQVAVEALVIEMAGPVMDAIVRVGDTISYRAAIVNEGDQRLDNITLTDRFDPGLEHSQGASPIEWQDFGSLDPGARREVLLKFRATQPGRQCHTLEATASGTPPARVSACVVVQEEQSSQGQLSVRKTGPNEMREGEEDHFYVLVENTGNVELNNLQVTDAYDNEFEPIGAEPTDNEFRDNRVSWYITRLAPGEKQTFHVLCRAVLGNVSSACSEAVVRTADGLVASDRHCIPVLPSAGGGLGASPPAGRSPFDAGSNGQRPPGAVPLPGGNDNAGLNPRPNISPASNGDGELELTMESRGDRWRVGDTIEYFILIRNNRNVADNDVVLTIDLPPQLRLRDYYGPTTAQQGTANWQQFRMVPVRTLRPGESVQYQIRAEVVQAGQILTRAEARSVRTPNGVLRDDQAVAGS